MKTPIDYEAVLAAMDEDIRELIVHVSELEIRLTGLELRDS